MRDVTPENNSNFFNHIRFQLGVILAFLRHPLEQIKNTPTWGYKDLSIIFLIVTISAGVLRGAITLKPYVVLAGIFITPVVTAVMLVLFTLMFYYYFQIFENKTHSFRSILSFTFFANIPFMLFQIGSEVFSIFELVGFAFTGMLLVVGLTERFGVVKKRSIQLVAIIFTVVFVVWVISKIDINRMQRAAAIFNLNSRV